MVSFSSNTLHNGSRRYVNLLFGFANALVCELKIVNPAVS